MGGTMDTKARGRWLRGLGALALLGASACGTSCGRPEAAATEADAAPQKSRIPHRRTSVEALDRRQKDLDDAIEEQTKKRHEVSGLSRDEAEVDKYIADPLCGFTATTQLWAELLSAMPRIARPENRARIRKSLPIYLFTGGEDPVNEQSRGCVALAEDYRRIGLKSTSYKVYPRARHETLNELNREEVTAHLLEWLDALVHLLRNQ